MRDETEIKEALEKIKKLYEESLAYTEANGKNWDYGDRVRKEIQYLSDMYILEWVLDVDSKLKLSWM